MNDLKGVVGLFLYCSLRLLKRENAVATSVFKFDGNSEDIEIVKLITTTSFFDAMQCQI